MKILQCSSRWVVLALTLLAVPIANAGKPAPGGNTTVSYTGERIGYLTGNNQSQAFGVSRNGNVVGASAGGSAADRAFYWDARARTLSSLTSLGARGGAAYGIAGGATEYAVGQEDAADGSHAVIWIAPPSEPVYLDGPGSVALGVNDAGTAVGTYRGTPAIWSLKGGTYSRTDIPLLEEDGDAYATDINDDGVVIGYGYAKNTYEARAFLRLTDGTLVNLPPLAGDPESLVNSVSNVVTSGSEPVVYVAGGSGVITIGGTPRSKAIRWTVNRRTGEIVETRVLTQTFTGGVNDAGDVAGTTNGRSSQAASLYRNGTYYPLKPPKGGTSTTARGLVRTIGSPTYAVGVAMMNNWPVAVRWVIK